MKTLLLNLAVVVFFTLLTGFSLILADSVLERHSIYQNDSGCWVMQRDSADITLTKQCLTHGQECKR